MNKLAAVLLSAALVLGSCFGLAGCRRELSRTFFTLDTVCTLTVYEGQSTVLNGAVELCTALGKKLNSKAENNEIAVLNQTGQLQNASEDLLAVINKGLYYSKLSNGLFDITLGAVTDLWDFKNQVVPQPDALKAALKTVRWQNLSVAQGGKTVTLKNGARLELGAIAKGYIADKLRDYFLQNGVKNALINLGGNVYALGQNGRKSYTVGVQTPFETGVIATLPAKNIAVVTSGTYQRGFTQNGVYYHHLLNPKTGMPQNTGYLSVTVLAKNSVDADALSTLCYLYGEKGPEFMNSLNGVEAVWVNEKKQVSVSGGLLLNGSSISFKNAGE